MANRFRLGKRGWLALIFIGLLVLLVAVSAAYGRSWQGYFSEMIAWVDSQGPLGVLIFIAALVIVCITGAIPASMMAIAAGTMFGLLQGTLIAMVGLLIGGAVGFLIARHLFGEAIRPLVSRHRSLSRIDSDIVEHGWKMVALLRLSPVAPFGITSYAFGLTRLRFTPYLFGMLGSLPGLIGYVYIGAITQETLRVAAGHDVSWIKAGLLLLGAIATLIVGMHFLRLLTGKAAK